MEDSVVGFTNDFNLHRLTQLIQHMLDSLAALLHELGRFALLGRNIRAVPEQVGGAKHGTKGVVDFMLQSRHEGLHSVDLRLLQLRLKQTSLKTVAIDDSLDERPKKRLRDTHFVEKVCSAGSQYIPRN